MRGHFDTLAALLRYPDERRLDHPPGSGPRLPDLDEFVRAVADLSLEDLQELYVRTFEMSPDACLDIGWHLFGENYERGEFLVRMRQTLRRWGVAESVELPDHLSHVLPALGRMERGEAAAFAEESLAPALKKIIPALDGNPYQHLLRGVESAAASLREAGVGA